MQHSLTTKDHSAIKTKIKIPSTITLIFEFTIMCETITFIFSFAAPVIVEDLLLLLRSIDGCSICAF